MKFIKFTEEEKQRANEISLIDYLYTRGEKLKHVGSSYFVESLNGVSVSNNKWYDHYNKKGGLAVGFLKEFYGYNYVEAVVELLGEENIEYRRGHNQIDMGTAKKSNTNTPPKEIQKRVANENKGLDKTFKLPDMARNNDKLYEYLCNKRFINRDIVNHFIKENKLFQSLEKNNVIFVGLDENNKARAGCAKGTYVSEKGTFTQTLTGSECEYCFNYKTDSEVLCVYEAPIDMLSCMTLLRDTWHEFNHIALDGVSEKPLLKFLEQNKNIKEIKLCLDNDIGGFEGTERIKDILKEHGYTKVEVVLSTTKDWNEDLKELNGVTPKPSVQHPRYEAYLQKVDRLLFFYKDNYKVTEESLAQQYSNFINNYKIRSFDDNDEILEKMVSDTVTLLKKHLKHIGKNVDENKIFKAFTDGYRTYKDKGRIESKVSELYELMKDFNKFREKAVLTEEEKVSFIKNMMYISSTSIRVNINLEELHNKELAKLEASENSNINFKIAETDKQQVISFG